MELRHIQARVYDDLFRKIKKKAIDLGLTVEDFLKASVTEKLEREEAKDERDTTDSR